jgi:4-diphosphocytidyl-2-C-methyl-D-erythritol kinase
MRNRILREAAHAKINLAIDILGKREDGYHDLKMVMASVSLRDELTISLIPCEPGRERFSAESDDVSLPNDEKNLAVKAAKLFFIKQGIRGTGAHIKIQKRIPVCAGLGGGSSDAAAVLRALAKHFPVPDNELAALAPELGSDVPYCLWGGVCLAEGRGEHLSRLPALPDCYIVLTVPDTRVSTGEAFSKVNPPVAVTDWAALTEGVLSGDTKKIAVNMRNAFPDVYSDARARLLDAGALGAVMSGSGPSVFGLFTEESAANRAAGALQKIFTQTFLVKPV